MAISLLTGVLVTLGLMIPRSVMHLRNNGWEVVGVHMAQQMLDTARGLDAADIPTDDFDGTKRPLRPGLPRQFPPSPYPTTTLTILVDNQPITATYTFRVKVEAAHAGAPPDLRRIIITTTWKEPDGAGNEVDRSFVLPSHLGP